MDKGSTLYDYTRSAEELRVFELGETCSRIIHEYEMFNLQNDVYKMFGEWLLNEAKTKYSVVFTSKDLIGFLNSRRAGAPDSVTIAAKKEDYDSCENLRMLSSSCYWNYKSGYESGYAWYTLWKITKAYNKKNGCIVMNAPRSEDGCLKIDLDWSKDAQECITREKWRSDAKKEFPFGLCALFGGLVGAILGFLVAAVLAIIHISAWIIFGAYFGFIAFCAVAIGALSRSMFIDLEIDKLSKDFNNHCERIEETRYSRYSIRLDDQRDWVGHF